MTPEERRAVQTEIGNINEALGKLEGDIQQQKRVSADLRAEIVRMETEDGLLYGEVLASMRGQLVDLARHRDARALLDDHRAILDARRMQASVSDNLERKYVRGQSSYVERREVLRKALDKGAEVVMFPTVRRCKRGDE